MKPYRKYKPSGIDWVKDIPIDWRIEKLKFNANIQFSNVDKNIEEGEISVRLCNYLDVYRNEKINNKIDFMKATASKNEINKFKLRKGDVLITKDSETPTDIAVPAFVENNFEDVLCGYHLAQIHSAKKIEPEFLFRLFQSKDFNQNFESNAAGMTRYGLSVYSIKNAFIPMPLLLEQQTIVQYLNYKTKLFDDFISNRQRQIKLLTEQKAGIRKKVVTKGIHPNTKMKMSEVDWIGEMPEHWELMELKFAAKLLRGKFSHRPRNDKRLYDGKYPFIQTGDVTKTEKYITSYSQTLNDWGYSVSKEFPKGTVVITIAANIGDIAILDFNACFPDSIVGFFSKKNLPEYLFYLFKAMKQTFLSESIEGTQLNLSVDRLSSIKIPLPKPDEQKEILDYIKDETIKIETLISKYQKQIDLMQEYRTAVISNAVTGKIDVGDWKPKAIKYEIKEIPLSKAAEA